LSNERFTHDLFIFKENLTIMHFDDICARGFKYYHELISADFISMLPVRKHLFIRLLYHAETTSSAIFLLINKGLLLQSLSLCRVRLEQVIVTSYLIHEVVEVALAPFVYHMKIKQYRDAKMVNEDPVLSSFFDKNIDFIRTEAAEAQRTMNPSFEKASEAFCRKWTNLDLLSMAKKRDRLTKDADAISKKPLELVYKSLYPLLSSFVHCDMASVSQDFLKIFSFDNEKPGVLMPDPSWAVIIAGYCCLFDIIQIHETLAYVDKGSFDYYKELENERISVSKEANL